LERRQPDQRASDPVFPRFRILFDVSKAAKRSQEAMDIAGKQFRSARQIGDSE
jgi:hypothetical protein